MKQVKWTILFLGLATFLFTSCKRDPLEKNGRVFTNNNIIMTGTQVVPRPGTPSSATGKVQAEYSQKTRTLTYTISWSGLAGRVDSLVISGPADTGSNGALKQKIIAVQNAIATPNTTRYGATCSINASLLADGIVVREEDILAGKYYVHLGTQAPYRAGEIRGQITFPQ